MPDDPEPIAQGVPADGPFPFAAEDDLPVESLVRVGQTATLSAAHDEGLVALACGEPYWITRDEGGYNLLVRPERANTIGRQLTLYRDEASHPTRLKAPRYRVQPLRWSLLLLAPAFWVLMFAAQELNPSITNVGAVDGARVMEGEWWRLLTALSLHGDLGHLVGNCIAWLLFGGFLASVVGAGVASCLAVVGGMVGNGVNVLMLGGDHLSLGASTALFAGLGAQTALAFYQRRGRLWQRMMVPFLSALALLAFLGSDVSGRTDVGAHLWGFVCGLVLTLPLGLPLMRYKATLLWDTVGMLACCAAFCGAWSLALA